MNDTENDVKTYGMNVPEAEGIEGYVGVFFGLYLRLGSILATPDLSKDPMRLYYLSTILVSMIPDEDERENIRIKMRERKQKITTEFKKEKGSDVLTNSEKDHIQILSALESIGFVHDFCDKMIGLAKFNKIGYSTSKRDGVIVPTESNPKNNKDYEEEIE